jgi:hypothetical protein
MPSLVEEIYLAFRCCVHFHSLRISEYPTGLLSTCEGVGFTTSLSVRSRATKARIREVEVEVLGLYNFFSAVLHLCTFSFY